MDFFGNVQGVEVEGGNETEWREKMVRLEDIISRARARGNVPEGRKSEPSAEQAVVQVESAGKKGVEGAAKVEVGEAWGQRMLGAGALLGCALLWGGASWLEASR